MTILLVAEPKHYPPAVFSFKSYFGEIRTDLMARTETDISIP